MDNEVEIDEGKHTRPLLSVSVLDCAYGVNLTGRVRVGDVTSHIAQTTLKTGGDVRLGEAWNVLKVEKRVR